MRTALTIVMSVAMAAPAAWAAAQPPTEWFGTWVLDVAKSTYNPGPAPYKRARYTIEPWENGLKVIYDMVHPRGGTSHFEWIGRLDGRPYRLQGIDEFVTYAYRPLGDGSYEVTVRIDDRMAAVSRLTLSPDGRTMTTATVGKDSRGHDVTTTTVYEKVSPGE
jgi:hypothetical protein